MTTVTYSKASCRIARLCVTTALAAGLLAGCAAGGPNHAKFASGAQAALTKGSPEKAIALAEQAVLADPRNSAYRTLLGTAYLRAGRFEAAKQAYEEAMQLGEDSGKAALSLALCDIALGRTTEAADTLNGYRESLPAADYGLAMAMAGQTAVGIAALTDALRAGGNTAKMRQNLAYAYALDGSWREAKLMAQQDVPADKLNERLQTWAAMASPDDTRRRVASLIGAPLRSDTGQPMALALANFPEPSQLANEAAAKATEQSTDSAAAAEAADFAKAAVAALPAAPAEAAPAAAPQPALAHASSVPARAQLAAIDLPPSRAQTRAQAVAAAPVAAKRQFTSKSAVLPVRAAGAPAGQGSPVIQLGAFASAEGAQRAWRHLTAQHAGLSSYHSQFSEVTVKGRKLYRVQASGFAAAGAARQMCESVKAKGGVCLVMAEPRGVTPQGRIAPTRMAQR